MEVSSSPLWTTLAGLCAAGLAFAGGYLVGSATAGPATAAAPVQTTFPDWFLPIWDAYDRDSAITPQFDFASLYSGKLEAVPLRQR